MLQVLNARAAVLASASSFCLGVLLPLMMAPASKSSPLLLGAAAVLAFGAVFMAASDDGGLRRRLSGWASSPATWAGAALAILMAISVSWGHNPAASARQLMQFALTSLCALALCAVFPLVADRRRLAWWVLAAALTAAVVIVDIKSGLNLRKITGGRETDYSYNRAIVTVVVLLWPLLALIAAERRLLFALPLVVIPAAVYVGESQTAVLGLLIGLAVFPIAWLMPRLTRWLGLATVLAVLAISPFVGTVAKNMLGEKFHKTFEASHSGDRVDIWLSFEAAARKRPFLGNGFGSSLNLQKAAVAREIAPERVTLLGASHPHNAFLQLWVELGAAGALLAAALFVHAFRWIGRADPQLQPYLLTWIAVVCGIALVSHGAWQAWWIAAIGASAAGFAALQREKLTQTASPKPL
jgi:exopolysaccharide production protein ExoQ